MKTPFIWLGSGRAKKWPVGTKGLLLDQAAKSGLPVPAGAILLDEFFQLLLNEGIILELNGRFTTPDPQWLYDTLYQGVRFPRLHNPAAVRATTAASIAPLLAIDFNNAAQLSGVLCEFWSRLGSQRRDILVMEMISGELAGTAVTRSSSSQDTILLANKPPIPLPQLRPWRQPDTSQSAYLQRLQMLLRGIRRSFGKKEWQIDWIDDGRVCWLLQIQPI